WRLGLVRQLMRILAVVVAYFVAIVCGPLFRPVVRPFFKAPDIIISMMAGVIFGLVTFSAVVGIPAVFFKRKRQQETGPLRFLYGIGGALGGVLFGLFAVWLMVVGVRSLGAVANAHFQAQPNLESMPSVDQPFAEPPAARRSLGPQEAMG